MKVVLSTIRRDAIFDLARHFYKRDVLTALFTGYPMFKLRNEDIPAELIHSFPWVQTLYMAKGNFGIDSPWLDRQMARLAHKTLDDYSARNLPDCDVFFGFASCALKTGLEAQKRGKVFACERPNSHIRYQDAILAEEFRKQGRPYAGIDPQIIRKEEQEYDAADVVVVPSIFAKRSFLEMGVPDDKVSVIPYGVNLDHFSPVAEPDPERFEVLFVGAASLRKGIPYLLQGFAELKHPNKQLTIVGAVLPETEKLIKEYTERHPIKYTGRCPKAKLKEIMSQAHVMVLPSIEDGFGMVMAEAMACGCPVIATTNTGGPDLYDDGIEGFTVPIRDASAITERMQWLADNPDRQRQMSAAAIERVRRMGGWDTYGDAMLALFNQLAGRNGAEARGCAV